MKVITETTKTQSGEMHWIVLKDDKDKPLGNLGIIDFHDGKLMREVQKAICDFLQGWQE